MGIFIKANIKMVDFMVMGNIDGQMALLMKDNLSMGKEMDEEDGSQENQTMMYIQDSTKGIKNQVKVYTHGVMGVFTMETSAMT